jgi:hypothetical protein
VEFASHCVAGSSGHLDRALSGGIFQRSDEREKHESPSKHHSDMRSNFGIYKAVCQDEAMI